MIAVFALGTSGDIQPLLILSSYLLRKLTNVSITFTTNSAHMENVETFFPITPQFRARCDSDGPRRHMSRFSVFYVRTPPLGLSGIDRDAFFSMDEINSICAKISVIQNLRLVIANLFCLAGWIVAESRLVPCILIHPHKPPSKRPPDFRTYLKRCNPTYYRQMLANDDVNSSAGFQNPLLKRGSDCISLLDYEEWLWPTLSTMYDSTRVSVNMPSCLSYYSGILPLQPIVLLAVSPRYFPIPGYWPLDQYLVTGCITNQQLELEENSTHNQRKINLTPILQSFLDNQKCDTVLIDFGSMTELLVKEYDWRIFFLTILRIKDYSFVISCHSYKSFIHQIFASMLSFTSIGENDDGLMDNDMNRIYFLNESVCHPTIFKQCVAVLHHGGAGTMGTSLLAGIPQGRWLAVIICLKF